MGGIYILYKTYLDYRQKYTSRKDAYDVPDAYDDERNVRYEYMSICTVSLTKLIR